MQDWLQINLKEISKLLKWTNIMYIPMYLVFIQVLIRDIEIELFVGIGSVSVTAVFSHDEHFVAILVMNQFTHMHLMFKTSNVTVEFKYFHYIKTFSRPLESQVKILLNLQFVMIQDPILSFSHTFSSTSARIGGRRPPPPPARPPPPPNRKSWIHHW